MGVYWGEPFDTIYGDKIADVYTNQSMVTLK